MRCETLRELFSDWHNGELGPEEEERLERHLESCAACEQAAQEFAQMMSLIAAAEPPTLPSDFRAVLHERLMAEAQHPALVPKPAWPADQTPWLRVVKGAGLVLAGAAAMLLVFWLSGPRTKPSAPRASANDTVAISRSPAVRGMAVDPAPKSAQRLRVGQVAVLVLTIRADVRTPNARLQIVLPDGVALLGEGHKEIEEKTMTWSATLKPGDNEIRVPVRARRSGSWRLVARARATGFRTSSETRLMITRT